MNRIFYLLFALDCLLLAVFSYGFVDINFPLKPPPFLFNLVHSHRLLTTIIHIIIVGVLFGLYLLWLRRASKNQINISQVKKLIFVLVLILFFSWPAFSYDIFNYLTTAKVAFLYKENPYLVMPIEFLGEPMLVFTHAANKFALYGPIWILLTGIPYYLGKADPIFLVFSFKAFILFFYLMSCWFIWRLSQKNIKSLVFFAFNPLIIIETLVSSHNDMVMVCFLFLAFYWFFQKKRILGFLTFLFSIGIKYATLVLSPLFLLSHWLSKEKIIFLTFWLMLLVFLLSPLREEIYPWYFIWVLAPASLLLKNKLIYLLSLSFSLGLLLRYIPFLYTRRYDGFTPLVKMLTTFIPPLFSLLFLRVGVMLKKHESRH